jgi:hypothetical protein
MLRISVALVGTIGVSLLLAGSSAKAQVPDPVMAAEAPTPGSGHNYIGLATETVNPADGSLAFDLPLPLPPGRHRGTGRHPEHQDVDIYFGHTVNVWQLKSRIRSE